MDPDRATLTELLNGYNAAASEAQRLGFLVRDTELQNKKVDELIVLKNRFRGFKAGARRVGDENAANVIFHMQCGLNAMISFLRMWIDLKKSDHESAWVKLVDAQEYVSMALRASNDGVGLDDFIVRLKRAEEIIFPAFPVYHSVGQIIRGGTCTICDKSFNSCEHIEGQVYWGTLCVRARPEIVEVDHVAYVDEPRDRRCIITEITEKDGYYYDYMTGKKKRKAEEEEEGTATRITGIIFHNPSIEID